MPDLEGKERPSIGVSFAALRLSWDGHGRRRLWPGSSDDLRTLTQPANDHSPVLQQSESPMGGAGRDGMRRGELFDSWQMASGREFAGEDALA
jgi:hypothetical protein